jgi:hypothetical protein
MNERLGNKFFQFTMAQIQWDTGNCKKYSHSPAHVETASIAIPDLATENHGKPRKILFSMVFHDSILIRGQSDDPV